MPYLKLIEDKIQSLAESLSAALNVEITVVDSNLLRIAGTGDFYDRINENSPGDSLFSKVLKTGIPEINIYDKVNPICDTCSYTEVCKERKSLIYPITVEDEISGVASFATFDSSQDKQMLEKKDEYMEMLKHFAESIEKEILGIKMLNRLNVGVAEINEIINSINKGIIILDNEQKIININSKATQILNINLSTKKISNKKINSLIKDFKARDTNNKKLLGNWVLSDKTLKVLYKVSYIKLNKKYVSILVEFDALEEIIDIAMSHNDNSEITFDKIIGHSQVMLSIIEKAKIAAKSTSTIFLSGASGTGKELFARSIHNASSRSEGPFVAINCASLPDNLIESELFGYEKGSFTGASAKGKIGKFEQANNGTLFLDEIADLPLHLQGKLTRVLQEKKIDKIGGMSSIPINVRIISATHKNLEEMVKEGKFREDLYYRLNILPLYIPPLKDRDEDVLLCAEYIIQKISRKMGKPPKFISKDVEKIFLKHTWPGNVRELENVLEYAINFSTESGIYPDDLPKYFLKKIEEETASIDYRIEDLQNIKPLEEMVRNYEKSIIKSLLNKYGDTTEGKKKIAERLNISVTTLYRKLNDYL